MEQRMKIDDCGQNKLDGYSLKCESIPFINVKCQTSGISCYMREFQNRNKILNNLFFLKRELHFSIPFQNVAILLQYNLIVNHSGNFCVAILEIYR